MVLIKTMTALSLLHGINCIELPHESTAATPTLLPRFLSGGCGLSLNIWGQVSPLATSGNANLCLQCRLNILGFPVSFSFYDALSTSINAHGVSVRDATILQTQIQNELIEIAARATTRTSCTSACSNDRRCAAPTWLAGTCRLQPVDYVSQRNAGGPLAAAFRGLFSSGGYQYCALCPSDRSCGASPSGLPRRSTISMDPSTCPSDLTACPLSQTTSFNSSTAFECLNVAEELTSCGGCATLGQGVDCSNLRGVESAGCSNGKCKIFSCKRGYNYSEVYNICYKTHRSSKLRL